MNARANIDALAAELDAMLLNADEATVTEIAVLARTPDCVESTVTVRIRAMVGKAMQEFSGNAMDTESAVRIARMKVRDARDSHARAVAKGAAS